MLHALMLRLFGSELALAVFDPRAVLWFVLPGVFVSLLFAFVHLISSERPQKPAAAIRSSFAIGIALGTAVQIMLAQRSANDLREIVRGGEYSVFLSFSIRGTAVRVSPASREVLMLGKPVFLPRGEGAVTLPRQRMDAITAALAREKLLAGTDLAAFQARGAGRPEIAGQ